MNLSQKKIVWRVGLFAIFAFIIYLLAIINLNAITQGAQTFRIIAIVSVVYLIMMMIIWLRERSLYYDYIMKRRIESGNAEYLLCPYCKMIQVKGREYCSSCEKAWIICRSCQVPFESESKILISPCCGQGFHFEHFESDVREYGVCPHCHSDLPLETTNW